jgi:hypothetical protein
MHRAPACFHAQPYLTMGIRLREGPGTIRNRGDYDTNMKLVQAHCFF